MPWSLVSNQSFLAFFKAVVAKPGKPFWKFRRLPERVHLKLRSDDALRLRPVGIDGEYIVRVTERRGGRDGFEVLFSGILHHLLHAFFVLEGPVGIHMKLKLESQNTAPV